MKIPPTLLHPDGKSYNLRLKWYNKSPSVDIFLFAGKWTEGSERVFLDIQALNGPATVVLRTDNCTCPYKLNIFAAQKAIVYIPRSFHGLLRLGAWSKVLERSLHQVSMPLSQVRNKDVWFVGDVADLPTGDEEHWEGEEIVVDTSAANNDSVLEIRYAGELVPSDQTEVVV